MLSGAASFAQDVLFRLKAESNLASDWLEVRARGKTAIIGLVEEGEWTPLLRLANGSGAFNVMDLEVRSKDRWAPTGIRGIPDVVAAELIGPLRFTWEFEVQAAAEWQRTSDQGH